MSSRFPDYYKALEITPTATDEDVTKAHRAAALKHHPDKQTTEQDKKKNTPLFRAIELAYEVLSDPESRKKYDDTYQKEMTKRREPGPYPSPTTSPKKTELEKLGFRRSGFPYRAPRPGTVPKPEPKESRAKKPETKDLDTDEPDFWKIPKVNIPDSKMPYADEPSTQKEESETSPAKPKTADAQEQRSRVLPRSQVNELKPAEQMDPNYWKIPDFNLDQPDARREKPKAPSAEFNKANTQQQKAEVPSKTPAADLKLPQPKPGKYKDPPKTGFRGHDYVLAFNKIMASQRQFVGQTRITRKSHEDAVSYIKEHFDKIHENTKDTPDGKVHSPMTKTAAIKLFRALLGRLDDVETEMTKLSWKVEKMNTTWQDFVDIWRWNEVDIFTTAMGQIAEGRNLLTTLENQLVTHRESARMQMRTILFSD